MAIHGFENLDTLNRTLSGAFREGLKLADVRYEAFTMKAMSTSKANDYAWMGDAHDVREWVGDREYHDLSGFTYSLDNKKWESSVRVRLVDLEDDEAAAISVAAQQIRQMAMNAQTHPGRLVFETLRNGKTIKGYDGKNFFATDHVKAGGGTQSNLIAGGGQPPWVLVDDTKTVKPMLYQERVAATFRPAKMDDESVVEHDELHYTTRARYNVGVGMWQLALRSEAELNEANLQAALEKMMALENTAGQFLDVTPTLLIVPPSLRTAALKLVEAEIVSNDSNINKGKFRTLITPWVIE
jgi:phage major head subunit gpT-like protein